MGMNWKITLAATLLCPIHLFSQGYVGNLNRGATVRTTPSRVDAGSLLTMCEQLELRAEGLKKVVGKALKKSPPSQGEKDPLETEASNLLQSASNTYTSWSFHRDYDRCRRDFTAVLRAAFAIQQLVPKHRLRNEVQQEWSGLREEIDELVAVFQMRKIDWNLLQEPIQPK